MLTTDEILRAKAECGYNTVGIGAEAYAGLDGYVALFDKAIKPYLIDFSTTSSTVVSAASGGATVPITLAGNPAVTGDSTQSLAFIQGSNITVDVGPNQELSVIQNLSGLVATCQLSNAHGVNGSYIVRLRGGEQFVRDIFARIDTINGQLTSSAIQTAGIQQVDEVKIYASQRGRRGSTMDRFASLIEQRTQARRDLCLLLGIPYLLDYRRGGSMATEPY